MQSHDLVYTTWQQDRQRQFLREAERERLANQVRANHPRRSLYRPLLARAGRTMSHLGQRLEDAMSEPGDDILVEVYSRE